MDSEGKVKWRHDAKFKAMGAPAVIDLEASGGQAVALFERERGLLFFDLGAGKLLSVKRPSATLGAIRARFPGRRLWAVFEPRSNTSRRRVHQAEYVEALSGADLVTLKVPEPHDMVPAEERLDAERVVADLRARGVDARADGDVDRLVGAVAEGARPGDMVLVMRNGAFGGFIDRLLAALGSDVTAR